MEKIESNEQLIDFVKKAIKASGIKKNDLAENIGLSRQGLDNLLKKKSFSLDDANRILNVISLSASVDIDAACPVIFLTDKLKKLLDYKWNKNNFENAIKYLTFKSGYATLNTS